MTQFTPDGVSVKGSIIKKPDGRLQVKGRFKDPETGKIHSLLLNLNTSKPEHVKDVLDANKNVIGSQVGLVTGYHKGVKAEVHEHDKTVKYTPVENKKVFADKNSQATEVKQENLMQTNTQTSTLIL